MAHKTHSPSHGETPDQSKGWTRRVMSRDEITVRTGMQAYDAQRSSLVMGLKAKVWAGDYDPDLDEVAESMLSEREAECALAKAEEAADHQDRTGDKG
ncbi:MAG TPA: hypothetical protein VGM51_10290 [Armatimonadota bacterium]